MFFFAEGVLLILLNIIVYRHLSSPHVTMNEPFYKWVAEVGSLISVLTVFAAARLTFETR